MTSHEETRRRIRAEARERANMNDAFAVHMLSDEGKAKATAIAEAFDKLLASLSGVVPEGREMALVKTKLEEACFFAKKGMAKANCQP